MVRKLKPPLEMTSMQSLDDYAISLSHCKETFATNGISNRYR
ncbi:hypothetical protein RBSWK_02992 [Rhodopirellula baltica SWK14]|uniref:Uncharacterized protein n=1 Tax=Rhodopirellula baltica SWK14 TaxID=993516 RepID=L7CJ96_RHOBT|nr:hypothetical protein RBSWK_02992 [Rhodopirellula baltica SWK14]